jgi:hypothetical protein
MELLNTELLDMEAGEVITIEATLLGIYEAPDVPSPSGPDSPEPVPIIQEGMPKGGFFSVGPQPDNGANTFLAFVRNQPYEVPGQSNGRVLRITPDGAVSHTWDVNLGTINGIQHKADSIGGMISGNLYVGYISSHALNEGARIMAIWQFVIAGIVVPYPQGVRPTGKEGAFVVGQEPNVEFDWARLQTMIDTAANRVQANIVSQLQGKAQQGATLAIQGQSVLTLGNIYDSAGLFQRILETGYLAAKEGDLHAMAEYFAQHPYAPPPNPGQPLLPLGTMTPVTPPSDTGSPDSGATGPTGVSIQDTL